MQQENLARAIADLRGEDSQSGFAKKAGLSLSRLKVLEDPNANTNPTIETLQKLTDAKEQPLAPLIANAEGVQLGVIDWESAIKFLRSCKPKEEDLSYLTEIVNLAIAKKYRLICTLQNSLKMEKVRAAIIKTLEIEGISLAILYQQIMQNSSIVPFFYEELEGFVNGDNFALDFDSLDIFELVKLHRPTSTKSYPEYYSIDEIRDFAFEEDSEENGNHSPPESRKK